MRDRFIGWQCRIRQHAFRTQGGRPGPGMRPRVLSVDGREISDGVTVLLIEDEPAESIAQFRHLAKQTHDPAARLEAAGLLEARGDRFVLSERGLPLADALAREFLALAVEGREVGAAGS